MNRLISKNTILTVALLLYFLGLYAQKPFDAQRVDVHFSEEPLSTVLEELKTVYGLQFSYGNDRLQLDKKISFHSEGKTLIETLKLLFDENSISYAFIGNQLVLKEDSSKEKRRKERLQKKKQREEEREKREQQTLQRGTMFDFDLHSEIIRPKDIAEIEEEFVRKLMPTKEIKPLIAKTIEGEVVYEESLLSNQITPVEPATFRKMGAQFGQLSLMPFLSTNGKSFYKRNVLSFNVFWGINGGVNGVEIGLIGNSIKLHVNGTQLGGVFNRVDGHLSGLQAASLLNVTQGNTTGAQFSGFVNISGDLRGTQFSGVANVARNMYGMQFSALSNVATDVYGFQFSGLFNFANGKLFGSQIAGFGNVAWGGKSAVQLASIFNVSAKAQFQLAAFWNTAQELDGAQFAAINSTKKTKGVQVGLINSTKDLKGVQIGVINIAETAEGLMLGLINITDTIKGLPLGLINIIKKNGYNRFELFGSEAMYVNFGVKFGAKRFYHIAQFGWRIGQNNTYAWSLGVGAGAMIPVNHLLHLNLELVTSHVNERTIWTSNLNLLNQVKFTMDIRIGERTSLFVGPTANLMLSQLYNEKTKTFGSSITMYDFYNNTFSNTNLRMWVGFTAGLRF